MKLLYNKEQRCINENEQGMNKISTMNYQQGVLNTENNKGQRGCNETG
jgi:hypothetical protein